MGWEVLVKSKGKDMKVILTSLDLQIAVKEYFEKRNLKATKITFTSKDKFSHTDGWYTYYKPEVGVVAETNNIE